VKKFFLIFVVVLTYSCAAIENLTGIRSAQNTDNGSAGAKAARSPETPGGTRKNPAGSDGTPARTLSAEEIIAEAINSGDCMVLYNYISQEKDETDPKLISSANTALRRYTSADLVVPRYRNNRMDPRIRRVPEDLMEKVFVNPETALPDVTASLVTGISNQYQKAKVIHDWICDNISYDTEMYFSGRTRNQDYASVLKRKAGVCSGYSNLFNEMCRLAGVQSIGIQGYSKGFGYRGTIGNDTDHEWNAVKINGKWYLIDVTWDAGYVEKRTFIKSYSTGWLFLDSRPFLYSHLPEDDRYQFYSPVLSAVDFMKEPYVTGEFFQYGLSFKTDDPKYTNQIDGEFTFELSFGNSNLDISSELRTSRLMGIDGSSWIEREGRTFTFKFDVPDRAEYKGHIFARPSNEIGLQEKIDIGTFEGEWLPEAAGLLEEKKISRRELELFEGSYFKVNENGNYYFIEDQFDTARNNAVLKIYRLLELSTGWMKQILDFNIKAAQGYDGFGNGVIKYPYTYSTYNDVSGTRLLSPIQGTLQSGSTVTFIISSRNYTSFAIITEDEWIHFNKNSDTGNYELTFEIPAGVGALEISGGKDRRSTHWGLVRYDVVR
jgi:transglutaminase-like putative cysteine protease